MDSNDNAIAEGDEKWSSTQERFRHYSYDIDNFYVRL